jgi:hypothetical protein
MAMMMRCTVAWNKIAHVVYKIAEFAKNVKGVISLAVVSRHCFIFSFCAA